MRFVFDIDGTICFDGKKIKKKVLEQLEIINQQHELILATARPIRDVLSLIPKSLEDVNIIGANGTIIRKNNQIFLETISCESVVALVKIAKRFNYGILIDYDFNYYFQGDASINPGLLAKVCKTNGAICLEQIDYHNVIKVALLTKESIDYSDENLSELRYSSEVLTEFVKTSVNKYSALVKYFGDKEYVAFGNDKNDLALLNNSVNPFVVGNTIKIDQATKINEDDLVSVIEMLISIYN